MEDIYLHPWKREIRREEQCVGGVGLYLIKCGAVQCSVVQCTVVQVYHIAM